MSKNDVFDNSSQNGVISKRDQRKFQQVLKQIQASQNPESKSHKRRKNAHNPKTDPQARKLIKTESQISQARNDKGSSSAKQLSQDDSKTQQNIIKRQIKDLNNVYNKCYGIPEQSEGFSDYMVNYTYGQKSKLVEKQMQNWQNLENLGGKKIEIKSNRFDEQITRQINKRFEAQRQKVQELFSKNNKEFIKKVLKDFFPKNQ